MSKYVNDSVDIENSIGLDNKIRVDNNGQYELDNLGTETPNLDDEIEAAAEEAAEEEEIEEEEEEEEEEINEATPIVKEKDLSDRLGEAHMNLLPRKQLIITMIAASLNLFTAFVDQNSVTIALSVLAKDLHSETSINWAGTSTLLANTVAQVLFGRLTDIFGRKNILVFSIGVLGIADLCCGFAQTGTQFYVFRAFAGVGFGGIQGSTLVIVSDIVTLEQRGKYQGILGAFIGLGNCAGPFLMSAFIQHSSWRNFYYMMPAICFVQIILTYFYIDNRQNTKLNSVLTRVDKFKNIDYFGIFFGTAALTLVLIPLNGGGSTYSWSSVLVIVMFIIGGLCMIAFLIVEWKIPKLPMIPLRLFKSPSLNIILWSNTLYGMAYYSFLFFIPYYFQIVKGYNEIKSSLLLIPMVLMQAALSGIAGQIISKLGHYAPVINAGYFFWFISCCILLAFKINTSPALMAVNLFIMGVGIGCCFQPSIVACQAQAKMADRAVVISTRNVLRSLGGSLGVAIASLIVSNQLLREITKALNDPKSYNNIPVEYLNYMKDHIYSKIKIEGLNNDQVLTVRRMYEKGLMSYFYLTIPLLGICFISGLFVKDRGLKSIDEIDSDSKEVEEPQSKESITDNKSVANKV